MRPLRPHQHIKQDNKLDENCMHIAYMEKGEKDNMSEFIQDI